MARAGAFAYADKPGQRDVAFEHPVETQIRHLFVAYHARFININYLAQNLTLDGNAQTFAGRKDIAYQDILQHGDTVGNAFGFHIFAIVVGVERQPVAQTVTERIVPHLHQRTVGHDGLDLEGFGGSVAQLEGIVTVGEEMADILYPLPDAYNGGLTSDTFVLDHGITVLETVAIVVMEELAAIFTGSGDTGSAKLSNLAFANFILEFNCQSVDVHTIGFCEMTNGLSTYTCTSLDAI